MALQVLVRNSKSGQPYVWCGEVDKNLEERIGRLVAKEIRNANDHDVPNFQLNIKFQEMTSEEIEKILDL